MNKLDLLLENLHSTYGSVKRSRGPFLYTAKGVRLTDLFQEDGRAILGWGGTSAFTMLKNILNRGTSGSYFTSETYRLEKALSDFFTSRRKVFVFYEKSQALNGAKILTGKDAVLYRPWLENNVNWESVSAIVMEPALPWTEEFFILAVLENDLTDKKENEISAKKIAPPILTAITRSFYDLSAALQNRQEKDWFIYDKILCKYFTRKGPYLFPKIPEEKYDCFVNHCLKCEIVINPYFEKPSIVPFGADFGVFRKLEKNPFVI